MIISILAFTIPFLFVVLVYTIYRIMLILKQRRENKTSNESRQIIIDWDKRLNKAIMSIELQNNMALTLLLDKPNLYSLKHDLNRTTATLEGKIEKTINLKRENKDH
ncbi:hypothetical protein [uncultured Lactobacillus sp.]|uniref:hypothetical protein n=1 Tax=uncultured Lactobacillus sp. TaxID=153152 RepID=UPI00262D5095|nr:hypothetical protein [uncultured Lactobacillus sp.]